jgi:hypothetical protein
MSQNAAPRYLDEALIAWRTRLQERGVPADDLSDTEVVLAVLDELRATIHRLARCRLMVGSWDKRFIREITAFPGERTLSVKQAAMIEKLAYKYRRQLANLRG